MRQRGLRYMPALDGLRAVAVVAVILFHDNVSWAKGGYFGVDAFFVLSGFLITTLLIRERRAEGHIDLKAFWSRRARRLLPALAIVLLAVALYAWLFASPVEYEQLRRDGLGTIFYVANWVQVFSHQSYFQAFAAPSMLHHTWSLAIEEQFYVLWPLIVAAVLIWFRRSGRALLLATGALAAASTVWMAVLYQPGHDPSRVYYGTDTHATPLLVGAIAAMLLADRERRAPLRRAAAVALHVAAAFAFIALLVLMWWTAYTDAWQYRGGFLVISVLVAVIVAGVTEPSGTGPLGWLLSRKPLCAIGLISYGMYLWHFPVQVFMTEDRTGVSGAPLVVMHIALTLVLAAVSFTLIERPVRFGRLAHLPYRVIAPAAAAFVAIALVASTAGPVPAAYRALSASDLVPAPKAAPPAAASAGAPKPPLRVMLVGDSVAASLAPGLAKEFQARGISFWSAAIPGCGLASDTGEFFVGSWKGVDKHCLPPWRQRWANEVARWRPDVVLVLVGAQDTWDRRVNGNVAKFDTQAGAALALSDMHDAVNVLSSTGAHVAFLTAPYYVLGWPWAIDTQRSPFFKPWIDMWNSLESFTANVSKQHASVIDLNKYLDPDGVWTDTVNGVKVRQVDRMHLSLDGADFVAHWLEPQVVSLAPKS